MVHAEIQELLITGCRDTQTSADAHIGGSYNGALTYYLVESIKEAEGKLTTESCINAPLQNSKRTTLIKFPSSKGDARRSIAYF